MQLRVTMCETACEEKGSSEVSLARCQVLVVVVVVGGGPVAAPNLLWLVRQYPKGATGSGWVSLSRDAENFLEGRRNRSRGFQWARSSSRSVLCVHCRGPRQRCLIGAGVVSGAPDRPSSGSWPPTSPQPPPVPDVCANPCVRRARARFAGPRPLRVLHRDHEGLVPWRLIPKLHLDVVGEVTATDSASLVPRLSPPRGDQRLRSRGS
jgi:hypothetical protein